MAKKIEDTMNGYVYILINSAMPELVKIGSTTRNPHDRAKQLSTTGTPAPFKVYGFVRVADHKKVERAVHEKMSRFRYSNNREFFKIKPEESVRILENISGQYELKRQQDAAEYERRIKEEQDRKRREQAEYERRIKEEQDRKRREQFEQELFSSFERVCEDTEEKVNIKFYKYLEEYSGIVAWFLFTITLYVFAFKYIEVFITMGIAFAFVVLIYIISSKIVKKKFKDLEKIVVRTMEEIVGTTIWQEHKERCIEMLYEKYLMDESTRREIRQYRKSR